MTPIDYPTFVATVNADDLAMLTSFIVSVDVYALSDTTLAETLFTQAQRLDESGLLTELHRIYTRDSNGVQQQSFRGVVSPVAAGYVGRLARERVLLSRDPVPAA